ncbi:MAG: sugar ABC transporter ATP-binding protein [Clostridia bacterium]|nr:sugar ABC transporter ATP-binding protein [Clostridia bacterium]
MSSKQEIFLRLDGISKSFPGVKALSEVCLTVKKGEIHALVGGNGAGKSTLMKILSGAYLKDAGTIFVNEKETEIGSPRVAEALGISIIYQELNLLLGLTVAENIYLGRRPKNALKMIDWKRMNADAGALLQRLGIDINPRAKVSTLSIAQQQLVEIAKAMSIDARLVIMDEPTSSLTTREIELLFALIRRLKAQGASVIFISHRMDEIFEIADRVTVMRDGCYIGDFDTKEISRNELISLMIGREMKQQFPARNVRLGEELLRVEGLSDGKKIRDVSFSLKRGEVLGFAGLVGAGRTEVMRLLFGADKKHGGKLWISGREVRIKQPAQAIKNRLGFVTEDRKSEGLVLTMPLKMNVSMVAKRKVKKRGFLNMRLEREVAEGYVRELSIVTPSVNQKAVFLSGGNQQKVVLAKWLLSDSEIMILDEPTRGIDVGAKRDIYEIINRLAGEGRAIIVVSSETEELMGVCDRIIVMSEGRITGELTRGEFSQKRITEYAVGGIE